MKDAAFTQVRRGKVDGCSIRTDRYRFTQWDGGRKGQQLYDMQQDPGELQNLATSPALAEVVAEFSERLKRYVP